MPLPAFLSWIPSLIGIGEKASNVVDKWIPSAETKHKQSIEDLQADQASQDSARDMVQTSSHDDWFNRFVDALNRLPRPLFSFWAFGVLLGVINTEHLLYIPTETWWIMGGIITFWFGGRWLYYRSK